MKRKLLCIGCPTEIFHTLDDVAHIHGFWVEDLLKELREVIEDRQTT